MRLGYQIGLERNTQQVSVAMQQHRCSAFRPESCDRSISIQQAAKEQLRADPV
jgi:hypothetical protein